MDDIQAQIAHLKAEIAQQEAELADLEAVVLDIERELADFAERYDQFIQPKITRLEIIKGAIAELEAEKNPPSQLGSDPNPLESTWTPAPDYVPVEEQFRRAWQKPAHADPPPADPEETWKPPADYVPVEEQFRRAWQKPLREHVSPPSTPGILSADLKTLYRQLARRYHPDLATDPDERERRNRLMSEINAAYSQRDVDALRTLAAQPDDVSVEEPLATMHLRQLRQVHDQLTRRLAYLKQERHELLNGGLMELKVQASLAARQGRDLLQEMADRMEREYGACLARLDELRG